MLNPRAASWTLFHYWRSSASYRVRLALEYKGLVPGKVVPISLLNGESESVEHTARNPFGFVPVLEVPHMDNSLPAEHLVESLPIIEWLDDQGPEELRLVFGNSFQRQRIRALAEYINAGIQPLQNLTTLDAVSSDETKRKEWCAHFNRKGLHAFLEHSRRFHGTFVFGDRFSLADCCLIPQLYSANRFGIDLAVEFPELNRLYEHALSLDFVRRSTPEHHQPEGTR